MSDTESGDKCGVKGCNSSTIRDKVGLFIVPKDDRRRAWISFITKHQEYDEGDETFRVCSKHFVMKAIANMGEYRMGFAKFLRLTWTAVPSIHPMDTQSSIDKAQADDAGSHTPSQGTPSAVRKQISDNERRRRRLEKALGMKGEDALSPEELNELHQIFEFYDIDYSRTMDMSELNMALVALGYDANEEEVRDLAALMDVDGDMKIDFDEFCMIVEYMKEEKGMEAELREAFQCIDTNGCGYIKADELLELLTTQGNTLSKEEASELISLGDKNGEGKIDYSAFIRIIMADGNRAESTSITSSAPSSGSSSIPATENTPDADDQKKLAVDSDSLQLTSPERWAQPSSRQVVSKSDTNAKSAGKGERGSAKQTSFAGHEKKPQRNPKEKETSAAIKVVKPSSGEMLGSVALENP